jgi:hypothetical protein
MDMRTRALQTLAAGPYLMLCDFPGDFAPLQARAKAVSRFSDTDLSTWRPAHALYFTVKCVEGKSRSGAAQLLFDQETGGVYYLRRDAWLPNCRPETTILAHFVEDEVAHGTQPGLLLFDVLREGGESLCGKSPERRYERLRAIAEVTASACHHLFFCGLTKAARSQGANHAFVTVQWAGEYAAMRACVASNQQTRQIPHEIACELVLTLDPLHPSRPPLT